MYVKSVVVSGMISFHYNFSFYMRGFFEHFFFLVHPIRNENLSEQESENERPKRMVDIGHKKVEGIGPTTKQGMPIVLRSVKWFKLKLCVFEGVLL